MFENATRADLMASNEVGSKPEFPCHACGGRASRGVASPLMALHSCPMMLRSSRSSSNSVRRFPHVGVTPAAMSKSSRGFRRLTNESD